MSNAFYVYLRDDDGHRVEILRRTTSPAIPTTSRCAGTSTTSGAATSGPTRSSPSWYLGSAPILDLDGRPVPVVEQEPTERTVTVGADGHGTVVHRPPAARQPDGADV